MRKGPVPTPPEWRFWDKVELTPTCWPWVGSSDGRYGHFWDGTRQVGAHRWAYERLVGPIPEWAVLDHVVARGCTTSLCVNPDHLEPVTQRVNVERGDAMRNGEHNRSKTHCPAGHLYDERNTRINKAGSRECRACGRDKMRARRAREVRA